MVLQFFNTKEVENMFQDVEFRAHCYNHTSNALYKYFIFYTIITQIFDGC